MTTPDDDEYSTLTVALQRVPISRRQLYRYAKDGRIKVRPVLGGGQVYHAGDVATLAARLQAERARATAVTPVRRDTERADLVALREELRDAVADALRVAGADRGAIERGAREQAERLDRAIEALERPRWPRGAVIAVAALLVAVAVLLTLLVLGIR